MNQAAEIIQLLSDGQIVVTDTLNEDAQRDNVIVTAGRSAISRTIGVLVALGLLVLFLRVSRGRILVVLLFLVAVMTLLVVT